MVIIRVIIAVMFFSGIGVNDARAENTYVQIYADACEKIVKGESKSSTRLRASDKATFTAVKNMPDLVESVDVLSDHNLNVMIYRFVDEYVEDIAVKTIKDDEEKICVEVKGRILSENIQLVKNEFLNNEEQNIAEQKNVIEIVETVKNEVSIKPENPESLALVHVKNLEYFNGTKSVKYANMLKKHIEDNPYFYLTEDAEIADYVITPKVLTVKVDALDAGNKRLHMALVLEIDGLEKEIVSEYQNRFVLFGAEEDNQKIASRLISKLIEQAGDGAVRKIEHREQEKLETKALGRTLN